MDTAAGNLLPFHLVHSEEATVLLNTLELRYVKPTRKILSATILCEQKQDKLSEAFKTAGRVSITVDVRSNHTTYGLTIQCTHWQVVMLISFTTGNQHETCKQFDGRTHKCNTVRHYEEVIETFHLHNKRSHVVSDSVSYMTKVCEVTLPQFVSLNRT